MDERILTLLRAAIHSTGEGKLDWDAFDDETFRAAIGSGTLRINRGSTTIQLDTQGNDVFPTTTYTLWIMNRKGQVVADHEETESDSPGYQILNELFESARKAALKPDAVIEDMLSALTAARSLKKVPSTPVREMAENVF